MPRLGQRHKPGTQDSNRAKRWKSAEKDRQADTRNARREKLRHPGNAAPVQPPPPGKTPPMRPYGVHMRNTSPHDRGNWAAYVRAARESALLSKAELARRLSVDRGTIGRWEDGKNRPEDANLIARFADVLGLDRDEALAAAGLRPGVEAPAEPTREVDEEIELVRTDPKLDADMKRRIITLILERRERDKTAALEETRRLIDLFRRS